MRPWLLLVTSVPEAGAPGAVRGIGSTRIERARSSHRHAIEALLRQADLPLDGLDAALDTAVVALDGADLVGCAALQPLGADGLLRSVAVVPQRRGAGVGRRVVEAVEQLAASRGIADLYLLTETAAPWFARLGYEPLPRTDVPEPVRGSVEFAEACPETAVAMHRALRTVR